MQSFEIRRVMRDKWRWRAVLVWAVAFSVLAFTVGVPFIDAYMNFVFVVVPDQFGTTLSEQWAEGNILLIAAVVALSPVAVCVGLAFVVVALRNKIVTLPFYDVVADAANLLREILFGRERMEAALSLISFGLGLASLYFLLGIGSMFDSDEEISNALALGLLIPLDPIILVLAVPGIIGGTIARKHLFAFDGFAQAGRIICVICLVLSFTKVGAIAPLMTHSVATLIALLQGS